MGKGNFKKAHIATRTIHVGGHPDPETGAIMPPIYQTSTYVQSSPGKHKGYEYTRSHNPTRTRLEECLASLEKAKYCVATSSGMAAVALLMHRLPEGSTIICGDDVYGGTHRIFNTVFHKMHNFHFMDTTDTKLLDKEVRRLKPDVIWLETPTNPMLKVSNISKVAEIAKKKGSLLIVDNTFMSPYFQNPLTLGADIVVHSMTKYINGHSDVVGGCIMLNSKKIYQQLWTLQNSIGPSLPPFDSWLILRGLKTLAIRMERHQENAMQLAQWLEKQSKVEKVIYPGLVSHPQHFLAKTQMNGYGGMISFIIKGGLRAAKKLLESVEIFALAESLGGVESLIEHPAIMTHAAVPQKMREKLGISNGLIRLSVGIENIEDLRKDLAQALRKI